ncbi:hypothetical protein GRX01_10930 [Halobaculum sp. WSA2]|uniref:O-antigen ligase-related domain-containing protein n=1 Tax=Halobaculum saliterrae TaxID=2073113 RepID=A0A6B0STH1_9EURY|nr:O-antigen ligase family protein [Halobaculum saliterrae]MXR41847.1 hypothetical protein [Halobaculum saliterrae]
MLIYILILGWVFITTDTKLMSHRRPSYPILVIIAVYIMHIFISAIDGQNILIVTLRSVTFVVFAIISLYVLPNYFSRGEFIRVASGFSAVIVAIGLPTAIFGDYSALGVTIKAWPWKLPFEPQFLPNGTLHPVQSVTNNPNVMGLLTSVGTICSMAELYRRKNIFMLLLFTINSLGVFLSGSRAALLAVTAGTSLLVIWRTHSVQFSRLTAVLGVIGLGIFTGLVTDILPFPQVISSLGLRGRTPLWRGTIEALSTRPIFGFGPGSRAGFIRPFVGEEWHGHTPHNSYLRMYLTTGAIGGTAYVYFTIVAISDSIRKAVPPEVVTLGIVAVVVAIMQTFAGFSLFGISFNSVLTALIFGFAVCPYEAQSNRTTSGR